MSSGSERTRGGSLPIKLLFVCTANKMRSKTAEVLYKEDERFCVKSAGIADFAEVQLSMEILEWADYVVVMEDMHLQWIQQKYPNFYSQQKKKICILEIPDRYDYMDPRLIPLLKEKFEKLYSVKLSQ